MPDTFDDLQGMLDMLKTHPEHPEMLALQRSLLDVLKRAARQLPEVQALLTAARDVSESLRADDLSLRALRQAIKAFD